MKSRLIKILLCLFAFMIPVIGESAWIKKEDYVVTPNVEEYNESPVCISFDGGGRYYSSIEDALDHANARAKSSMQILVVTPGIKTTIKRSCKIGDNVILYVPYDRYYDSSHPVTSLDTYKLFRPNHDAKKYTVNGKTKDLTNGKTGPIDINYEQTEALNSTEITLAPNVQLTIEHGPKGGQLYLGGEYGERGINGYHSAIYLSKGAKIYNGGFFKCCGYVKELYDPDVSDETDTRMVMNDNASLITPMGIYGFPYQGSTIDKLITGTNQVCPITTFDFPCIQTNNVVKGNANFQALIHIYRNIAGTDYVVDKGVDIANSTKNSNSLFKTPIEENNSLNPFTVEFDYKNFRSWSEDEKRLRFKYSYPDPSKDVYTKCNISGKVELGSLYFELDTVYKINTTEYFLPISHRLHINIKSNGLFYAANKIKIMPGSHVRIDPGGQIDVSSELVAYKKDAVKYMDDMGYPSSFDDAYIVNNGNIVMTSKGAIGGKVITEDTNGEATLNLLNTTKSNKLFVKTNEGKLKKEVITQLEGTTLFQGKPRPCFFQRETTYWSIKGSSTPGWKIDDENIPHKIAIKVDMPDTGKYVYAYDILKNSNLVGNFLNEPNYEIYKAPFEKLKINVKRMTNVVRENMTVDERGFIDVTNDNGLITITPTPAKYLNIIESNRKNSGTTSEITAFSGRGTVVTKVYESTIKKDAVYPNDFYLIAEFGSACENLLFGQDLSLKIVTDYGNWAYEQETLEWGNVTIYSNGNQTFTRTPGTDVQDFKGIDWVLSMQSDCQIIRYGGEGRVCFAKDTLITMGDGTQKPVQDVTINDKVMAMNHETGRVEPTKLLAVVDHGITENNSIILNFDNNRSLTFVGNHEIFDYTTMGYEEINANNVDKFIGHEFASFNGSTFIRSKLIDYKVDDYKAESYTLVSYGNLNIIAEGMLTFTSDLQGLVDYFEYDNDLSYNKELMNKDIQKYGLYTYDEWKDLVPRFMFDGYNFKYFKVSIGKGLMTYEDVLRYIEYSNSLLKNGEMIYPKE